MSAARKRIMRVFKINEISMVDEPAQSPAVVSIMKRKTALPIITKQEPGMTPEEKIAALEEQLKAAMEEIASYKTAAAAAAATKEAPPPDEEMKAAEAAKRAVVFTSADGTVYTKAHDPLLVKMARERDEDRKALRESLLKGKRLELAKRASDELSHLSGEEIHKVTLLEVIETIADETVRKAVTAILHANDAGIGEALKRRGTTGGAATMGTAEQRLDTLVKARAAEQKIPFAKAYGDVLDSPEGAQLYSQMEQAKRAH